MENALSEHYSKLRSFRKVIIYVGYIVTVLSLVGALFMLISFGPEILLELSGIIGIIFIVLTLVWTWYVIYNVIRMVNFLFDLDKHKSYIKK